MEVEKKEEEEEFEEDDEDYEYAESDDEDTSPELRRYIVVNVEATAKEVGIAAAYQWQKELAECPYAGHQDECDRRKFYAQVFQDVVIEIELDSKHPLKPPRFDVSFPLLDAETTLMIRKMECLDPKKWNFCAKLGNLLKYVEEVLRSRGKTRDKWSDLETSLYDLGEFLQAQPKCAEKISKTDLPDLPKFGQESALAQFVVAPTKKAEEQNAKKQKTQSEATKSGFKAGTGYGSGHTSGTTSQPLYSGHVPTIQQPASERPRCPKPETTKAEATHETLLKIMERIEAQVTKGEADYVRDVSPWQPAVLPFVNAASLFDFEKYASLFEKIEAIAILIGDLETIDVLRRRNSLEDTEEEKTTTRRRRDTTNVKLDSEYRRLLAPEHVLQSAMGADPGKHHKHHNRRGTTQSSDDAGPHPKLAKRAMREFQNLLDGLPLDESTAIFARQNSDNLLHFKFCIVPSSETPYAYGCFVFSVLLPRDYPQSPPSVDFQTTDSGRVRFNPNLYADGKVCLSLLGTWPGAREEQWDPENSNLLSVALSIQALIFNDEPYFNEPGYESQRGTPMGDQHLKDYNDTIKFQTKRVAIDLNYKFPPPEFQDAIQKHVDFHRRNIDAYFKDAQPPNQRQRPAFPHTITNHDEDDDVYETHDAILAAPALLAPVGNDNTLQNTQTHQNPTTITANLLLAATTTETTTTTTTTTHAPSQNNHNNPNF